MHGITLITLLTNWPDFRAEINQNLPHCFVQTLWFLCDLLFSIVYTLYNFQKTLKPLER